MFMTVAKSAERCGTMLRNSLFRNGLMAVAVVAQASVLAAAEFKAGFARVDITPANGTPLAGYYSRRASEGVLDPLYARCVAVSDGESRAIILSIDNLHLADPVFKAAREAVFRRTGVPVASVFIACTHTHTGPSSYVPMSPAAKVDAAAIRASNKITVDGCAEAAAKALADLAPSKIMIGRGEARGISFIRRYRMKDGSVRTNPGPNNPKIECALGEPDEQLQLVRFVREGKPEIAVVNFQTHPDVIGGKLVSADWPGLSCGYLEAAMGGSICAMFINGAQGDVNHIKTKIAPGEVVLKRYEMSKHMARVVAGAALATWGLCKEVESGKISAGEFQVEVEPNKGTPEELVKAEEIVALHKAGRSSEIKGVSKIVGIAGAYRMLAMKNKPDKLNLPVSMVTIGKTLAFGGFPGEPFTWMGTELKARSPFTMTIPACCVNASQGYFPVKSAYTNKGGYENSTARYKAGTAEKLVEGLLENIKAAYDGQ